MKMKALMLVIATSWIIIGSGCASEPVKVFVPVIEPLPIPSRPVLPALSAAEVKDLSNEALTKLIRRDRLRRQYCEQLEAIILSTHKKGQRL